MNVERMFRVGVDVGGTNTDCVILNPEEANLSGRGIKSAFKTPTTADVTEGITRAIEGAISKSAISRDEIAAVMIGTTHFINAVVQADMRNLRKVAVLRICGPYTKENPAFLDFPPMLREVMEGYVAYLDGGLEFDMREIMPIDEEQVRKECKLIREQQISDIAICGVFSPLDIEGANEARVRDIVLQEIPDADVVLSRDIGQLGFLERENATILNTSILKFARQTIRGFKRAMASLGLSAPLFLTQNDGTIIAADAAERTPIKTFNSGPTNSMSGAGYLAGLDTVNGQLSNAQVIVADIGGTTTDVCALLPSGFPRQAGTWVEIGGVRCAFPMPEVRSIALGGGTKILRGVDGTVTVGPESVGHRLLQDGLVFGGDVLTATDVVVASRNEQIGETSRVKGVPDQVVRAARMRIKQLLESAIDSMKLSAEDCICIMVGGGSIVQMDSLTGVGQIIRPQFHDCANAVGAAIARVSGQVDVVHVLEGRNEDQVLAEVCEAAKQKAIDAGADADVVKITEVENMPLQYVQMRASRMVVKAAGPLSARALLHSVQSSAGQTADRLEVAADDKVSEGGPEKAATRAEVMTDPKATIISPSAHVHVADYKPEVDHNGVWWVSEVDCEFLATGSSILACGGGGPGYMCYMAARHALQNGARMPVVDISALPDDAYILGNISYGAPTVTLERTPSGTEGIDATDAMLAMYPSVTMSAQIALEIGGMNALRPLLTAHHYGGIPTVDADFMGRAYPRLYIMTPHLYDFCLCPATQADGQGNVVTVNKATGIPKVEKIHRKAGQELGLFSQLVIPPMTAATVKRVACLGTMSLAWYIGRAVFRAKQEKRSIMDAILQANPSGKVLYTGKIVHVHRYVSSGGYTEGYVRLKPLGNEEKEFGDAAIAEGGESRDMFLPFQNEYIIASLVPPETPNDRLDAGVSHDSRKRVPEGEVVAMVPDLISLVGTDGYALGTQDLRYGVRVSVLSLVANPHWYTERGIATGGPREFGYDVDFKPLGPAYFEPKRVMDEFRPRRSVTPLVTQPIR
ncbi:Hydantoin utilization protein A [Teratosphaeria destructans]|uniref:Hydantoin utilization protein A n=1 Tax=Teratosphaeria destructans TaxID=418781 RepID=A0A9W7W624_9PEZI|nr:Hydantoin utilization protein A [Teratosphaeria destructans]